MRFLFVSGWKRDQGQGGITQYTMDRESGALTRGWTLYENVKFNVTYVDEQNGILYALNEVPDLPGERVGGGGSLYLFYLNRETGECIKTDRVPTGCTNPCNMSVSPDGKYMLISSHGTRSYVTRLVKDADGEYRPVVLMDGTPVMLYERKENGLPGRILDISQHTGTGPSPKQTTPRPHTVERSPSGKMFAVCDKGNDHVYLYRIDAEHDRLVICGDPVALSPGTEPRYCVFHPQLPFLYQNTESSSEVFAYRYDEEGHLTPIGSWEALQQPNMGKPGGMLEQQGLYMHPSGKYLYDVVHGPNQVAVFQIDPTDGALTLIQNVPVEYDWPRGVTVSPDGRFLVVTCARGHKVVVYRVGEDGLLTPTGVAGDHENAAYATFWDT